MPPAGGFLGSGPKVPGQTEPDPPLWRVTRELTDLSLASLKPGVGVSANLRNGGRGAGLEVRNRQRGVSYLLWSLNFLDWPGPWCPVHREQWSEVPQPHLGKQVYPDMGVARVQPSVSVACDPGLW